MYRVSLWNMWRRRARSRPAAAAAHAYVSLIVVAGCAVLISSIAQLRETAPAAQWWALVALTLVSGSAVLKLPSIPANFSISDVFTLTSAVVFGGPAGTVLVAIDSLVISMRLARTVLPLRRVLFNAAAPPVAMWLSAQWFFRASGLPPLLGQSLSLERLVPWLLLFSGVYFVLNTFAIAAAIALHQRASAIAIWRRHFQSLWLTFVGGALGAVLVVIALQLGRYGLVLLSLPLVLAAILHFAYRNATGRVADQMHHLAEVNRLHLSTIEALAHAIDAQDSVTHGHIRRVQSWAVALAARIGLDEPEQLRALEAAALLHDIGKLAVPEHILNKPGRLTPAEFDRMKAHATVGAEILAEVEFPYPVVPLVRHHHENWDGSGYPDGLRGPDIPIGARILSVVDCFDALTSDRPYRRALSAADAFKIVDSRRGTMYDPAIVDAFRDLCRAEVAAIGAAVAPLAARPAIADAAAEVAPAATEIDQLRVAVDFGVALSSAPGADRMRALTEALHRLPEVDTVAVFVVDERQQRLIVQYAAGPHIRAFDRLTIPIGERISGWVAATQQTMVNGDAALDLFDTDGGALRCAIAKACTDAEGARAVITLYSTTPRAFSGLHERLLDIALGFIQSPRSGPRPLRGRPERARIPDPWHRGPGATVPADCLADEGHRARLATGRPSIDLGAGKIRRMDPRR